MWDPDRGLWGERKVSLFVDSSSYWWWWLTFLPRCWHLVTVTSLARLHTDISASAEARPDVHWAQLPGAGLQSSGVFCPGVPVSKLISCGGVYCLVTPCVVLTWLDCSRCRATLSTEGTVQDQLWPAGTPAHPQHHTDVRPSTGCPGVHQSSQRG